MHPLSFFRSMFTLREGDFFDMHFSGEILKSERIRCLILVGIFTAVAAWFVVIYYVKPDIMPEDAFRLYHGVPFTLWVSVVLLIGVAYELAFFIFLGMLVRKNLRLPAPPRLGNALIEVSIPTVLIFFAGQVLYSHEALMLPTSYLYFTFIVLSAFRLSFFLSFYTGLIASVEYTALAIWLITVRGEPVHGGILAAPVVHVAKGLLLLLAGIITGFVAYQIRLRIGRSIALTEERNRVVGIFGQHVSPEVVGRLLEWKDDPDSEMRSVCVMFLDIRGFTRFAEGREPQEVFDYLNSLFGFMIDIVNGHHGIINKFLGDGFMAVFGAPLSEGRDVGNAVAAAREIIERLNDAIRAGRVPDTKVGIGLHSGLALTGTVGSPARKEYTVIGDVVNLASRIEQLNKSFGSQVLISEAVWRTVSESFPEGRDLGDVEIRGHQGTVRIYRIA
ncbi:MAG: adenylate/guanylate cyclase domain-containing protein [Spirochaetes bacterium]|nr:adenylate/guanylate cyclase domain-containing protein [Spirochaetota bacterium]